MRRVSFLTHLPALALLLATAAPVSAGCTAVNCNVDFLFVIDNSDSMAAHQVALASAAGEMVDQLSIAGIDWRLAVTYTDLRIDDLAGAGTTCPGRPGPGSHVLCPFTRNIALFREGSPGCAYAHPGDCGDGTERGFNPVRFALDRLEAGTACEAVSGGECTLRPEANLVVVFVTDTGEQTPNGPPPPGTENTVAAWATYFMARGVDVIHGIACPTNPSAENPAPCGDAGISAPEYDRYRDVIAAFGGVEGSILDPDLTETIRRIVDAPPNTACPAAGFAAITCRLDGLCDGRPLPPSIERKVAKARSLVVRAAEPRISTRRSSQLLGRATKRLRRAAQVTRRLARREKLPGECATALQDAFAAAIDRIRTLRQQLGG